MSENSECNNANNEEHNENKESNKVNVKNDSEKRAEKTENESLNINDCLKENINTSAVNENSEKADSSNEEEEDKVQSSNIRKKFCTIIDSDSENEDTFASKLEKATPVYNDSENEASDSEHNISFRKTSKKSSNKTFLDSDSDNASSVANSDNEGGNLGKEKIGKSMPNRFQTLIDSESEGEHEEEREEEHFPKENKKKRAKNSESNIRKVSARASKEEAMKQIHSETQRLIRESRVSLPYHRPKQRSLQEFLSRKKVVTVLPKAPTMAAKLKMSSAIVDEVLKEKEKEAEIFYKSSDSEEEAEENDDSLLDKKSGNVESMQESKKENVSRKLFIDENLVINNDGDKREEINETVTEMEPTETETMKNGSTVNDAIENNMAESVIEETNHEFNNTLVEEITEKLIETPIEIDDLLEKQNVVTCEDKEENVENTVDKRNDIETIDSNPFDETVNVLNISMNDSYASIVKKSLGVTAEESDDYNEYGLPPPIFDDSPNINETKKLLSASNLKPKLKGAPGTVIDLSNDIKPNKKGINALIDRFVWKHSKSNKQTTDTSDVTATHVRETPNGLSIIKETLPYKLPKLTVEDSKLKKPGAKLILLKEQLKQKIALKRDEEWKLREQDMKEQEIEWNESINLDDNLSEPRSPSIESYISKEDELEEEEEEEEDDMYTKKEKKKSKCAFVDDEAEVSDDEMDDNDEIIEEDEDEDGNGKEIESIVLEDEDETDTCDDYDKFSKRKSFKRIVKPSEDDSRSCDTENNEEATNDSKKGSLRTVISGDMFSGSANDNKGVSDAESDIAVSQGYIENDAEYRMTQTPQTKTNSFKFISPLTQLTALNTRLEYEDESDKTEHYLLTDEANPFSIDNSQTEMSRQICNTKMQASQRKLFATETNATDEELMQLCSGKFTQSSNNLYLSKEPRVTESQLLNICSGSFNTQVTNAKESNDSNKTSEESEKDEMWNKCSIVSSDEEDLMEKEINDRSRKKVKKLDLSDDENENDSLASDAETEDEENVEDDEEKYVDYDSEENELIVPKKNIRQYAAKFVEEEAELSESDDGGVSADEDEKDLDILEFEAADEEDINEEQMKSQLGRLHMRQILDEDQREVRMLQELLFEDGDLHTDSGRERKFKWRNIDKQEDNDQSQPAEDKDGWVDLSDDEDEAKWCKIRHEREKFLAQNTINIDTEIENELNNSQIFKFGMKILKKRRIDDSQKQDTLLDADDSKMKSRIPHTIAEMLNNSNLNGKARAIHNVMQKRSFLAKGEKTLARLAALAKQKDAPLHSVNAKNFVFAHIDTSTETESALVTEIKTERFKGKRKR